MKKAILGKKIGMTQIFLETGELIPVTVVEAGPCVIVQKKTTEKDGYDAIKIGFGEAKIKRLIKPIRGTFDKVGVPIKKVLKEFRLEDTKAYEVGDEIKIDIFEKGDKIDISGISKGKGTQGAIKRHNQSRGPMSHGSKYHRGIGSMGSATHPGRVFKGKKMSGRMGAKKITVQNLEVVRTDVEKNLLLIKGAVPGAKGAVLFIKNTVKS